MKSTGPQRSDHGVLVQPPCQGSIFTTKTSHTIPRTRNEVIQDQKSRNAPAKCIIKTRCLRMPYFAWCWHSGPEPIARLWNAKHDTAPWSTIWVKRLTRNLAFFSLSHATLFIDHCTYFRIKYKLQVAVFPYIVSIKEWLQLKRFFHQRNSLWCVRSKMQEFLEDFINSLQLDPTKHPAAQRFSALGSKNDTPRVQKLKVSKLLWNTVSTHHTFSHLSCLFDPTQHTVSKQLHLARRKNRNSCKAPDTWARPCKIATVFEGSPYSFQKTEKVNVSQNQLDFASVAFVPRVPYISITLHFKSDSERKWWKIM